MNNILDLKFKAVTGKNIQRYMAKENDDKNVDIYRNGRPYSTRCRSRSFRKCPYTFFSVYVCFRKYIYICINTSVRVAHVETKNSDLIFTTKLRGAYKLLFV